MVPDLIQYSNVSSSPTEPFPAKKKSAGDHDIYIRPGPVWPTVSWKFLVWCLAKKRRRAVSFLSSYSSEELALNMKTNLRSWVIRATGRMRHSARSDRTLPPHWVLNMACDNERNLSRLYQRWLVLSQIALNNLSTKRRHSGFGADGRAGFGIVP